MFLQGDLQVVFDALYSVGAIDPVLKLDWDSVTQQMVENPQLVHSACAQINACQGDITQMVQKLNGMDEKSVHFVALEVAREFCEAHDRKELH
jgi:hypothetical protein